MDLALLKAFVRVSEVRSISEAAAGMGYSQPGLSQRVQTLERQLGCRLFIRGPQGVRLTTRGATLLPYARILLSVAEAMQEEAARGRRP